MVTLVVINETYRQAWMESHCFTTTYYSESCWIFMCFSSTTLLDHIKRAHDVPRMWRRDDETARDDANPTDNRWEVKSKLLWTMQIGSQEVSNVYPREIFNYLPGHRLSGTHLLVIEVSLCIYILDHKEDLECWKEEYCIVCNRVLHIQQILEHRSAGYNDNRTMWSLHFDNGMQH